MSSNSSTKKMESNNPRIHNIAVRQGHQTFPPIASIGHCNNHFIETPAKKELGLI